MSIEELINGLKDLPPAPRVLPRLLKVLGDENASSEDVVSLIDLDPALTARIIRQSNSAYYGGFDAVSDLDEAVNRLGFREIYRMACLICARSFVGGAVPTYKMESEERWFNSVATGLVMETLSRDLGFCEPSTAYTVGLLHDIGKLAIHQVFGDRYDAVFDKLEQEGKSLYRAEMEVLGFDHAQVGAALLEKWGFPEDIVIPIRFQYSPSAAPSQRETTGMLHVSHWIAGGIGGKPGKDSWAFELDTSVFAMLHMDEERAMQVMLQSRDQLKEKEEMLSM